MMRAVRLVEVRKPVVMQDVEVHGPAYYGKH
jgi:hypothetical protein